MRSKYPHEDLDRAVRRLQPLLERDGLVVGDFIASGAQGNVYEAGPGKIVKAMYGGSAEWNVAAVIAARQDASDKPPPGLVKQYAMLSYPDPAFGLNDTYYTVKLLVRERLYPDDARARRALSVLQAVLHWLTSRGDSRRFVREEVERRYYGLSFGNADIKIVALGMNYLKNTRQLPEDPVEHRQMTRDAVALQGAFMWLYGRGYKLKDYFDQYDMKPENVGFRERGHAVALDLGYVEAATP